MTIEATTQENKPQSLNEVLTFLENRIIAYSKEIKGRAEYTNQSEIRVYRGYMGVLE